MYLAKVVGTVVSTSKDERLVGFKLLLIQRVHSDGAAVGNQEVAVDTGSSARFAASRQQAPLDATIVGIVDVVEVED